MSAASSTSKMTARPSLRRPRLWGPNWLKRSPSRKRFTFGHALPSVDVVEALIIVDFQNDFTPPDGALAVPGGDEIAARLNELAADDRFDIVIATRDWHPAQHGSFQEQGGPWPVP